MTPRWLDVDALTDEEIAAMASAPSYRIGLERLAAKHAAARPAPSAAAIEAAELTHLGKFVDTLRRPEARAERAHLQALIKLGAVPDEGCGLCYSLRKLLVSSASFGATEEAP